MTHLPPRLLQRSPDRRGHTRESESGSFGQDSLTALLFSAASWSDRHHTSAGGNICRDWYDLGCSNPLTPFRGFTLPCLYVRGPGTTRNEDDEKGIDSWLGPAICPGGTSLPACLRAQPSADVQEEQHGRYDSRWRQVGGASTTIYSRAGGLVEPSLFQAISCFSFLPF